MHSLPACTAACRTIHSRYPWCSPPPPSCVQVGEPFTHDCTQAERAASRVCKQALFSSVSRDGHAGSSSGQSRAALLCVQSCVACAVCLCVHTPCPPAHCLTAHTRAQPHCVLCAPFTRACRSFGVDWSTRVNHHTLPCNQASRSVYTNAHA